MDEQNQTPQQVPVTPPVNDQPIMPTPPPEPMPITEPAAVQVPEPSTVFSPQTVEPAPASVQSTDVAAAPPQDIPMPQPATDQATQPPAPDMAGPKKKILLVEDDDALASVYETRLNAEGFAVQRVPNGEDALVSAMQYKPDLILLDVMMAKVSGFDVLDILRNTPETTNVKIIMLTALGQDSDKERAMSLGVDDYLVKSQVVIADVMERIRHQLGINR